MRNAKLMYGYMQICKTDGIIRNCYLQNVDLSGTVLSCPELRPGIGRDPYDHVSDHRDADYVLCGYARQFLRFRWSIFAGRRDDNHTMRNRDAAGCVQSAFVDCGGVITL